MPFMTSFTLVFCISVTCVIMQKNGAGLHTASSCYWDNTTDGKTIGSSQQAAKVQGDWIVRTKLVFSTTQFPSIFYPCLDVLLKVQGPHDMLDGLIS